MRPILRFECEATLQREHREGELQIKKRTYSNKGFGPIKKCIIEKTTYINVSHYEAGASGLVLVLSD